MATISVTPQPRNQLFDMASIDHAAQRTQQNALSIQAGQQQIEDQTAFRALGPQIAAGDRGALRQAMVLDPRAGYQLAHGMAQLEAPAQKAAALSMDMLSGVAASVNALPEDQREAAFNSVRDSLGQTGADMSRFPKAYPGHATTAVMADWKLTPEQRHKRLLETYSPEGNNAPGVGAPVAGMSGSYADRMIGVESGGRADARNPRSSASGAGQFIDGTWLNLLPTVRPDLATGKTPEQMLALRNDPAVSRQMVEGYARENAKALQAAGLPVNDTNLALAHRFGPDGATRVLSASPQMPLATLLGADVLRANPDLAGKDVAGITGFYQQRVGGGGAPVQVASASGTAGMPATATDAAPGPVLPATVPPGQRSRPTVTTVANPLLDAGQGGLTTTLAAPEPNALAPVASATPAPRFMRNGAGEYDTRQAPQGMGWAMVDGRRQLAPLPGAVDPAVHTRVDAKGNIVRINERTGQVERTPAEAAPPDGGGPLPGKDTISGNMNILLGSKYGPETKEYASAYAFLAHGEDKEGKIVRRDMSPYQAPTWRPPDANVISGADGAAGNPATIPGGVNYGTPQITGTRTMTEGQSNAALYADRMVASDKILDALGPVAADPVQRALGAVPLVGNYAVSSEYQQAQQAQRDFINAVLRRESGAAIAESEFENARKQYFPQPGDTPETLANKKANRATAITGIQRAAGPAYKPPEATQQTSPRAERPTGDGGRATKLAAVERARAELGADATDDAVLKRAQELFGK